MKSLLFFDDWFLRAREGLDRKQGQPSPVKEVVLGSHPELSIIRAGRFHRDAGTGRYVMYVDCHHKDDRKRFCTRLETEDPYNWPEPQWTEGTGPMWTRAQNAVVDQNGNPISCFNIVSLAGTPLAEKGYFVNFYDFEDSEKSWGPVIAFSQDGLHFEVDTQTHWAPHKSDTGNPVIYNSQTGEDMIFCRPEFVDRRVAMLTTTDFATFSTAKVVLQPDAEDPVCREFYGLDPFLCDDVFVGMLSIYDTEPTEGSRCQMQGTNEAQVAYSYNGQNWYRACRQALIPRTEPGTQLGGCVYAGAPVRTSEDRLLFCVMGSWGEHAAVEEIPEGLAPFPTYLYEMRLDGFAYLKTRARHGRIRTKTVVPHGGELTMNVRTTPSGYVKVAVLDARHDKAQFGKPIPNYTLEDALPVSGDELFGKIRWRERDNLDELKGRPVMLEVHAREADLYALRFGYDEGWGVRPGEENYNHYTAGT